MTVPYWLFPPRPRSPWPRRLLLAALGSLLAPPLVAAFMWLTGKFLWLWMQWS